MKTSADGILREFNAAEERGPLTQDVALKKFYIETLMADATLTESTLISRMSDRIEKCCTVAAKAIRDYIPEYIGLVREGSADTIAQQMLSWQGNVFVPPLAAKSQNFAKKAKQYIEILAGHENYQAWKGGVKELERLVSCLAEADEYCRKYLQWAHVLSVSLVSVKLPAARKDKAVREALITAATKRVAKVFLDELVALRADLVGDFKV